MVKPGYLTTEFWATVLLNIASVTTALTGAVPPKWSAILSTISVAVYALARSLAKTGAASPPPPQAIVLPITVPPAPPTLPPAA